MSRFISRLLACLITALPLVFLTSFVLGITAMSESSPDLGRWLGAHAWTGLAGVVGALLAIGVNSARLRKLHRRISGTVHEKGLPDWLAAQADKAARRADRIRIGAAAVLVLAVSLGFAASRGPILGRLHLGMGAAVLPYAIGTAAVELLSMAALSRVARQTREVADRVAGQHPVVT